jgi:excisionase family DNA binding protein
MLKLATLAIIVALALFLHTNPALTPDHLVLAMAAMPAVVEPLLHTIEEAGQILGLGRSSIYKLIEQGHLEAVRILTATRITGTSIRALLDNAPRGLAPEQASVAGVPKRNKHSAKPKRTRQQPQASV